MLNFLLHSTESQTTRIPNINAEVTLNLTSSSLIFDMALLNKASLNNYILVNPLAALLCCMTMPIPTGPRDQNQLNTMKWETLKHSPHTPDLMPWNLELLTAEKNLAKDTCSHQSTVCRRLWYSGFVHSLRNYLQMEYTNLRLNKLLLKLMIFCNCC